MSSATTGITDSQDGKHPSNGRSTKSAKDGPEKIHPQRELKSHLEKTARFIKAFDILVRAFAWLICMLAAWLLACVVDHWLLPLPTALRWLVWASLVGFTTWIAVWQIVPLVVGRINPGYAATRIERAEPRFKEGLIAWLQLSEMSDAGVPRGVMAALTYRAYRFIGGQDPSSTVDSSPLVRGLAGFLVLSCVMALYSFVSPKSSLATAARIAMPWRTVAAPTRVHLSEVEPGSSLVSAGKPLEVSVRAVGLHKAEPVHLMFTTRDGQIVAQAIPLTEPDVGSIYKGWLKTTTTGIEHELEYWIEAGDAVTQRFQIELAPAPSVVLERVELVYPTYTKLPKRISDGRDVEAIEGTVATIVARSNQDLVRGQLEINPTQDAGGHLLTADQTLPMDVTGRQLKRDWQPTLSDGEKTRTMRYSIRGFNTRNDSNQRPIEHSLTVVADVPPEVRLVGPKNRVLRVRPTSRIQLEIRASDPDFGLNEVELSVHKAGASVASRVVLNGDGLKGKQVKRQPLDIGRLSMSPGDRLELHATARDNRHDPVSGKWAPNETHADPLIVEVVGPDQSADVPSGGPNQAADGTNQDSDGQPDSEPNSSENPRPSDSGSDTGQPQAGSSNASNPTRSTNEASPSSSQDNSTGGSTGNEHSGEQEQSGSSGGAGKSSDDSGETQSTSEQSGGSGSSSSGSSDATQENANSSGGNSSSKGSNSENPSGAETSQGSSGSSGASQVNSTQRPSNGASESSNTEPDSSNEQSQADASSNPNSRGGTGDSPASDAQAMKQVEEFMQKKGETSSQEQSPSQQKAPPGSQATSNQQSENPTAQSSGSDSQQSNSNNSESNDDPNKQTTGAENSSEQSSGSGNSGSESPPSDGAESKNAQPQDTTEGATKSGESADSQQKPNGDNSSQQTGNKSTDGQQPQQNSSKSGQTGNNSPQNSQNADSGDQSGSSSDSSSSPEGGKSQGGESQGGESQGGKSQGGKSQGGEADGNQSQGSDPQGNQSGKGQSQSSSDTSKSSAGDDSSGSESGKQNGSGQEPNPADPSAANSQPENSQVENDQSQNDRSPDAKSANGQQTGESQAGGGKSSDQDSGKPSSEPQNGKKDPQPDGAPSGNQQASSQPSGSQAGGKPSSPQAGAQSQSGTSSSSSGNSSNSTGSSSTAGSSDRNGGGPAQSDAADKEAAAKAADMVLDYLDRQRDQPDPELLREINWNKNDLNRFVDRWKQARELASQGDDAASEKWEELLSALNLTGRRSGSIGPMKRSDDFQQMSDSAIRIQPPKSLLKRWEAVQRALEKR